MTIKDYNKIIYLSEKRAAHSELLNCYCYDRDHVNKLMTDLNFKNLEFLEAKKRIVSFFANYDIDRIKEVIVKEKMFAR